MSALRPYEILIIVDPRPTDEEAAALLTQLGEQVKSLGADVSKIENWGKRRLSYDIRKQRDGTFVRVAGWVIVRQRPGTAKGFMFLSLEDETGVSNIIVTPQLFERYRLELVDHPFLLIEGVLQNQDNVISVKARNVKPLTFAVAAAPSHDFH